MITRIKSDNAKAEMNLGYLTNENDKLREALEKIMNIPSNKDNYDLNKAFHIAHNALNK